MCRGLDDGSRDMREVGGAVTAVNMGTCVTTLTV